MATQTVDALSAECRALEEGLTARSNGDGTFSVRSSSRPGVTWMVSVGMVKMDERWLLKFTCSCEAGRARPSELVPCLHSAAVGRSLERRRLAVWFGGIWQASEKLRRAA